MSGLEAAGLAVGVLPILVAVSRSYTKVLHKAHTFRHCTEEAAIVAAEFSVIRTTFRNEIRLILNSIGNDVQANDILDDVGDWRSMGTEVEDRFELILQESYAACSNIMQRNHVVLEDMISQLETLDVLLALKSPNQSIRQAYKRQRKALKLSFDKSKYDQQLQSLRDRISELCMLRSQITTLQQQKANSAEVTLQYRELPEKFSVVQKTSRHLHQALSTFWRCDTIGHRGHHVKLCLDAEVKEGVRLDLAIACCKPSRNLEVSSDNAVWLYVQSMSCATTPSSSIRRDSTGVCMAKILPVQESVSNHGNILKRQASCNNLQPVETKKPKRDPRRNHEPSTGPDIKMNCTSIATMMAAIDLCTKRDLCHYLGRNYERHMLSSTQCCLGYLESAQAYKYLFYLRNKASTPDHHKSGIATPVHSLLRKETIDRVTIVHRLQLALKLAIGVIQFSETPWLRPRWRMENVKYLGSAADFGSSALKTLHVDSRFTHPSHQSQRVCHKEDGKQEKSASFEALYGIRNTSLFFLGIALLEIAYWQPLEEKMTPIDNHNRVLVARRLILDGGPLGKRFQKIARKCIECDFGVGGDLESRGLQSAVYTEVVCQLQDIIGGLERLSI